MNLKKLMSYRAAWMGVAIFWIVFFHAGLELTGFINSIKIIGYGGVDIFILASGLGNYYSYLRDEKPLDFLARKLKRLAPIYVPFICVWCALKVVSGTLNPLYVPGNILGIQGFSSEGVYFNWYLICILICYLLTPYLAPLVRKNSFKKNIILIFVLIIISTAFINDKTHIVMMTRLPIYVIGMLAAKYEKVEIKQIRIPLIIMFVVGNIFLALSFVYAHSYLWNYGLHWYPFIMIAPYLCVAISELTAICKKWKVTGAIAGFVERVGGITFEIYLVHIFVFDVFTHFFQNTAYYNNTVWLLVMAVALMGAWIYGMIIKKITAIINKNQGASV